MDTNLLLVYFIGLYEIDSGYDVMARFRYTKGSYSSEDFVVLSSFLARFSEVVTTPHFITEVSNLLNQGLSGEVRQACFGLFKGTIPSLKEYFVPGNQLASRDEFVRLGVADTAILEAANRLGCLVLTDDYALAGILHSAGFDVVGLPFIRALLQ